MAQPKVSKELREEIEKLPVTEDEVIASRTAMLDQLTGLSFQSINQINGLVVDIMCIANLLGIKDPDFGSPVLHAESELEVHGLHIPYNNLELIMDTVCYANKKLKDIMRFLIGEQISETPKSQ